MSSRTRFAVYGYHNLQALVFHHFIESGLVYDQDKPDFYLVGAMAPTVALLDKPVFLLSDDVVYPSSDSRLLEDGIGTIRDMHSLHANKQIQVLNAENYYTTFHSQTLCLRIFPVYGPNVSNGVVYKLVTGNNIIFNPGYQVRSFLHERDFLAYIGKLLSRFLRSSLAGVVNVGSDYEITILNLAKIIDKNYNTTTTIQALPEWTYRWKVVPDIRKLKALVGTNAATTLSKGIWEMGLRD